MVARGMVLAGLALVGLGALGAGASAKRAEAAVKTEVVEYRHGDVVLEGYLAYDDAQPGKRPGVAVFHAWRGHDEYVRGRARQLAEQGYVAFAADMYGKGVRAKDHVEAGKLSGAFRADRELMRARAGASVERLRAHPRVDATRIAAIGYCFGGTAVLELARSGADLAAVVSFHGALDTPHPEKSKPKARILVCHGADDPHVPPERVAAFADEMRRAKADWELIQYGGAVHSFTEREAGSDPTKGVAYHERADRRSWESMLSLFEEAFEAP